jgi:hypothetical protein
MKDIEIGSRESTQIDYRCIDIDNFNKHCRPYISDVVLYFSKIKGVNEVIIHGSCLQHERQPNDVDIWVWVEPIYTKEQMENIYNGAYNSFPRQKFDIIIEQDTPFLRSASTEIAHLKGMTIFKKLRCEKKAW